MIITSALKDRLLFYLCNDLDLETFGCVKTKKILKDIDIEFKTFSAIISQRLFNRTRNIQ